jgi:hypothetical protein
MAQHGNRHPDDLLSAGNPARRLTPDEIGVIEQHAEEWISVNANAIGQWLYWLPPIPPHPADRPTWVASLPGGERAAYEDLERTRVHLRPIEAALACGDHRLLLGLLTQARPGDVERAVRKDLYDIREAAEQRLADAVTAAIAAGLSADGADLGHDPRELLDES